MTINDIDQSISKTEPEKEVGTGSGTTGPSRVGGESRSSIELILKQSEDYVLKFTPDSDNAKTKVEFLWYEHTNRTAQLLINKIMPLKSIKQRKYLFAKKPKIVKRWAKKYGTKIKKS